MSQRGSQRSAQEGSQQPRELHHPVITVGTTDKFKPYVGRQPIQRVEHVFGGLDPNSKEYSQVNYSKWKTKQLTTNERNEGNFRFHVSGKVSTNKKNTTTQPQVRIPHPQPIMNNRRIHSGRPGKSNRPALNGFMKRRVIQTVQNQNPARKGQRVRTQNGVIIEEGRDARGENYKDFINRQSMEKRRPPSGSSKKTNAYARLVGNIKTATRGKLKK